MEGVECLKAVLNDSNYLFSDIEQVKESLRIIINEAKKQIDII